MAFIAVTNTFVAATKAKSSEVNTNFTNITDGLSDGTKDINVAAVTSNGILTVTGTANIAGDVVIGDTTGSYELHVKDAATPVIAVEDTTNNVIASLQADDSVGYVGTISNHALNVVTNNSSVIQIDTSGYFIFQQTDSRIYTSSNSSYIRLGGGGGINSSNGAVIELDGNDLGGAGAGGLLQFTAGTGSNGILTFRTGSSTTERARIDVDGGVMIGTSTKAGDTISLTVDSGNPSAADSDIAVFQAQNTRQFSILWDNSDSALSIGTKTNNQLNIHINNSPVFVVNTSGYLISQQTDTRFHNASNSSYIRLGGGGGINSSNGAVIEIDGNDVGGSGLGGALIVTAGTGTGGVINFRTGSTTTSRWQITTGGNLVAQSSGLKVTNTTGSLFVEATTVLFLDGHSQISLTENGSIITNEDNGNVVDYNSSSGLIAYKSDASVFTGYHYYERKSKKEKFEMGDAVDLIDGKVTKSNKPNSKNCVGIYSGHPFPKGRYLSNGDRPCDSKKDLEIASLGDSYDWNKTKSHFLTGLKVCNENGPIESGDLLVTSSKPGYLMKQSDDIIRSITVAKCMDNVEFDENGEATEIYGFLYCG